MLIRKNIKEITPRKIDGEIIYEFLTEKDKLPIGWAVDDVKDSELHYHKKTHEWYWLQKGYGSVTAFSEKERKENMSREIPLEENTLLYIPPGYRHKAKVASLGGPGMSTFANINIPFRLVVVSYPPWTLKDHYIIEE